MYVCIIIARFLETQDEKRKQTRNLEQKEQGGSKVQKAGEQIKPKQASHEDNSKNNDQSSPCADRMHTYLTQCSPSCAGTSEP